MKLLLLLPAFVWGLVGCQKDDASAPRIDAPFDQQVTLRQQQSGAFPNQRRAELTIKVDDVKDARCPKDVVCVWEGTAEVLLTIQAGDGASQSLTLDLNKFRYPDQATVQANGRAYLVVLHNVTPYPKTNDNQPPKSIVLSVQQK
jgi:hypothetical protein